MPLVAADPGFLLFFLRPQTNKAREHRKMLAELKSNDEVVTTGGLIGRIVEIGDKVVTLEIAPNVRVRVERSQITATLQLRQAPAGKKEKAE